MMVNTSSLANELGDNTGPSQDMDNEGGPTPGGSDTVVPSVIVGTKDDELTQSGPGSMDEQGVEESDLSSIQLSDLQTTHQFIDALKSATLEGSGMEPQDITELRQPELASNLVESSPLVRSLHHFINNTSAS